MTDTFVPSVPIELTTAESGLEVPTLTAAQLEAELARLPEIWARIAAAKVAMSNELRLEFEELENEVFAAL